MAKEFLSRQGIDFVDRNVLDPGVQEELEGRGFRSAPVVFVDGQGYAGFDPAKLAGVLGLAGARYATKASTDDVVERHVEVVDAWVRAAAQIPTDQLDLPVDTNVPDIDLRRFLYQAPHLEATMTAHATGVWDASRLGNADVPNDAAALASDLDAVARRFRDWIATLTEDDLARICEGFYGQVRFSRILEQSLGRLAFHLRRLYAIMRDELGIEPQEPLDDARLAEVAVPAKMLG